jgi:hypothetical protein
MSHAALLIGLVLVIARATFLDTLRDPEMPVAGVVGAARAPGATTSLVFDLLMGLPAMIVLLRRCVDRSFQVRSRLSHLIFAAFALLALVSTFWSSDRFAAAVNATHLLAAAGLMWAMAQIVRNGLRVRLVAAACFGLLMVYVAQGAIFWFVDRPDTVRYWQEHRAEELARRGWEPGSFQARQFEQKLVHGELYGFNSSPNTFAALIVMLSIIAAGVAVQRIVDRDEFGWAAATIVGIIPCVGLLYLTQSKTAFLTPLLAAALLLAAPLMARRRKLFYILGVVAFFIGSAMLIGHGIYHGSLLIASLTFRWRYWVGSFHLFLDHPLIGVGWANFGNFYLAHRLPVAAEEIKDPHNLLVRAATELGIGGLILLIGWLARLWWELTAATEPQETPLAPPAAPRTIGFLGVGAIVLSILAVVDFSAPTIAGGSFVLVQLYNRLLFLLLLVLGLAVVALRSSKQPQIDTRPAPWIVRAIIVAVAVFLIHNLIDFSMFEPGPMMLLALLVGTGLGMRSTNRADSAESSVIPAWGSLVGAVAVWGVIAVGLVAPVALAEAAARQGDDQIRAGTPSLAARSYRQAFDRLWIPNGDYAYRAALALAAAGAPPRDTLAQLNAAIAADPINPQYYRTRTQLYATASPPQLAQAAADYQHLVQIDPNNVQLHLELADLYSRGGERDAAIEEYERALEYNDQLDPAEPKRLTEARVAEIRQTIAALRAR